jgi:mono/diheme cytochrome c family protein
MNLIRSKIALSILIIGLLSACGGQPTNVPTLALQPTEEINIATETPTNPPSPTVLPTETLQATEPAAATQPAVQSPQGATVSFVNDVFPIIQSRCINCHGGDRTEEGLVMLTYADIMAGSDNGPVITAGDAENSLLAELVSTQKMPKRGPKLTPPQVQAIIDWINQGALDN